MNEKKKIIDMLANGKIDANQAEELLRAISSKRKSSRMSEKRKFVFEIMEQDSEKKIVHIDLPVTLLRAGLKFIPKEAVINAKIGSSAFDISSINWDDILSQAAGGDVGDLLYMEINNDDKHPIILHIYIK
ncbi:MAG TPA: hypothetical protein ENL10_01970 [Candidatus Cloacimonetes bacterium]|nr:hypothetical protein [Candidatus Cloacimonadota bacterium]